jgi:hypothetical protein
LQFDDGDCAKFIVEVVLVDPSYQIIRSFMDYWILQKLGQKTFEIYRNIILSARLERNGKTPLHVAGEEGNENIFRFLYSSLASRTQDFECQKSEIEHYLLKKLDRDGCLKLGQLNS